MAADQPSAASKTTAALEQQSQTRLRRVTTSDVKTMYQLPNTVALGWRDTLVGFVGQVRQRTLREIWTTDRQPLTKNVKL